MCLHFYLFTFILSDVIIILSNIIAIYNSINFTVGGIFLMYDDLATIGFPFSEEISDPAIRLTGVGIEVRSDESYYYDNRCRNIDSYAFQYTLEGSGIFEVDNTQYALKPGMAFFTYIPANTKYYCNPNDTHWKFIFVLFMGKSMIPYYKDIISKRGMVFELDKNSPAVVSAFNLFNDAKKGLIGNPFSASSAAFDFVCKLCTSVDSTSNYSALTKKAIDLLSENFHKAYGVSDIASVLNVSASHLSKVFKNNTGITAIEYLTKIRLNHALRMLANTEDTIDSIAHNCGFDNGNYFCKVFKKYNRMTPSQYRKYHKL